MGRPRGQGAVAAQRLQGPNPGRLRVGELNPDVAAILAASKPRKYHNTPTEVDGKRFASKREAARFQELASAERLGVIRDLETQRLYRFEVNGVKVGRYAADFYYVLVATGETVVEDAKGVRVRDWSRTKKLMLACFGITVVEV